MIVVDTNVIAYLFLPGEHSDVARRAFLRDPSWAAPALWRSELRSVLAISVRERGLRERDAVELFDAATDLMRGGEFGVNSELVIHLAAASNCSAYDCEFVALALELDVPLVTADRRILREFGDHSVRLEDFTKE